jgi:hypothetical protein
MSHLIQKIAIGALLVMPAFAIPAMAQEGEDTTETNRTTVRSETNRTDETNTDRPNRTEGKLSDARKKICENRQTRITAIMTKAATNGQRLLSVFDKALTRVQDFYTKNNLSVANYDALVATANSKKQAAQAAIDTVKAGITLDCSGENPVGKVNVFVGKVKAMHQALKDYRSSIRDIIKAVKPVAEAKENEGGRQ